MAAERVRAALGGSFEVDGIALDVEASVGLVVSGLHGDDAATLLQRADVAMYVAKEQGRGSSSTTRTPTGTHQNGSPCWEIFVAGWTGASWSSTTSPRSA